MESLIGDVAAEQSGIPFPPVRVAPNAGRCGDIQGVSPRQKVAAIPEAHIWTGIMG